MAAPSTRALARAAAPDSACQAPRPTAARDPDIVTARNAAAAAIRAICRRDGRAPHRTAPKYDSTQVVTTADRAPIADTTATWTSTVGTVQRTPYRTSTTIPTSAASSTRYWSATPETR